MAITVLGEGALAIALFALNVQLEWTLFENHLLFLNIGFCSENGFIVGLRCYRDRSLQGCCVINGFQCTHPYP